MKHVKFSAIVLATVLMLSIITVREARATGVSLGASTFYAWWSPSFKDNLLGKAGPQPPDRTTTNSSFSINPSFLVGPSLSINLPAGFSVTSVFLWSSWFHVQSSYYTYNITSGTTTKSFNEASIKKYDLDVLINYMISRYIKLFCGLKYQGYERLFSYDSYTLGILPSFNYNPGIAPMAVQKGIGPGIGIGITLNIFGPFYLLSNISALYMQTNLRISSALFYQYQYVYNSIGFNGTISIAWLVEPASVTIALGFRYQYLHHILYDSRSSDWAYRYNFGTTFAFTIYDIINDEYFYGITLSATYSFNFSGTGE